MGLAFSAEDLQLIKTAYEKSWRSNARRMAAFEERWKPGLKTRFNQQKNEVLDKMKPSMLSARFYDDTLLIQKAEGAEYLFEPRKWQLIFEEFGQMMLPGIIGEQGEYSLGRLVNGISFDVKNPRVTQFISQKAFKFSFDVNTTTENMLRREFQIGLEAGEDIRKLGKRVEKVFGFSEKYRTERIARTETGAAYNFGGFESYKQSGVVQKKKWLATNDNRTRDSHAHMNGQVVGLNETFSNGLMYPSDPSGPAEEIIQCRCAIAAEIED